MSNGDPLDSIDASAALAARWCARHQKPSGEAPSSTSVIEASYKGLWSFSISGYHAAAHNLGHWLSAHLDATGDCAGPRDEPAFLKDHYLYANGYMAIGARMIGRLDIAGRALDFIQSRQHPAIKGFWSHGPAVTPEFERMDTVSTSISLLAATFGGRLEMAEQAAGFLQRVLSDQPEPDKLFYSTVDVDGNLLRQAGADETHAIIDVRDPEQDWYFIGLPPLVLAYLYRATGNQRWLDLACDYLDYLADTCDPGAFLDFSSGKSAVAAAHLYRLTERARYRDIALGISDFIISKQTSWGFFCEDGDAYGAPPTEIAWSDMDMTFEYILWLRLIAGHLSAARGDQQAASSVTGTG